jgi:hypothetical protein
MQTGLSVLGLLNINPFNVKSFDQIIKYPLNRPGPPRGILLSTHHNPYFKALPSLISSLAFLT